MKKSNPKSKPKKRVERNENELFLFCTNCGSLNVKTEDNPLLNRFDAQGMQCQDCGAVFSNLPQAPLSFIRQFANGKNHSKRLDQQTLEVHASFSTMSLYYGLMVWGILTVTVLLYVKGLAQQLTGILASTLFVWAMLFVLLHAAKKRREHALKRSPMH